MFVIGIFYYKHYRWELYEMKMQNSLSIAAPNTDTYYFRLQLKECGNWMTELSRCISYANILDCLSYSRTTSLISIIYWCMSTVSMLKWAYPVDAKFDQKWITILESIASFLVKLTRDVLSSDCEANKGSPKT